MPLFNTSFFILPVLPPSVDAELCDNLTVSDDRVKIAEAEAAFEEFEAKLSAQLYRHLSPPGRRLQSFPSSVDDLVATTGCRTQRPTAGRGNVQSPLYSIVNSLNLDSDLNDMDLSSTAALGSRASGSRLPRRVVTSRLSTSETPANHGFNPPAPGLYTDEPSAAVSQMTTLTGDDPLNSFAELAAASFSEPRLNAPIGATDSSNNLLAEEYVIEPSVT